MPHQVALVPGDGVGPEVVDSARRALDATGVTIEWQPAEAGQAARERLGDPLPAQTVELIRRCGVALKGPLVSGGPGPGPPSAGVELRRALDLYVGVALARSPRVDVAVVRMHQEDLLAGAGLESGSPQAIALRDLVLAGGDLGSPEESGTSVKIPTMLGVARVVRAGLAWAAKHGRKTVTVVHEETGSDRLLLDAALTQAKEHPGLEVDQMPLDQATSELTLRPDALDVILVSSVYGDLLSQMVAELVGGPGMTPCAKLGDACAIFEPLHGPAQELAGTGKVNPIAQVLAGAMLLRHLNEERAAESVERTVAAVVADGVSTTGMSDEIVARVAAAG